MAACGHCGGCCAHCGAICGGARGGAPIGIGNAFGGGGTFGGLMFTPWVGGVPHFRRHKRDDEDDARKVDCDALADPDHPGHREAVTTVAHVDDATHESILKRIKEELEKL